MRLCISCVLAASASRKAWMLVDAMPCASGVLRGRAKAPAAHRRRAACQANAPALRPSCLRKVRGWGPCRQHGCANGAELKRRNGQGHCESGRFADYIWHALLPASRAAASLARLLFSSALRRRLLSAARQRGRLAHAGRSAARSARRPASIFAGWKRAYADLRARARQNGGLLVVRHGWLVFRKVFRPRQPQRQSRHGLDRQGLHEHRLRHHAAASFTTRSRRDWTRRFSPKNICPRLSRSMIRARRTSRSANCCA